MASQREQNQKLVLAKYEEEIAMESTEDRTFERELASLLNKFSKENDSNTPDFILADYLTGCLVNLNSKVNRRAEWYGRKDAPGQSSARDLAIGQLVEAAEAHWDYDHMSARDWKEKFQTAEAANAEELRLHENLGTALAAYREAGK